MINRNIFPILSVLLFSCMYGVQVRAQKFFNLTADEVKVDSVLPHFTYSTALDGAWGDSVYTVRIEYPEFIEMSKAEAETCKSIVGGTLPAMPDVAMAQSVFIAFIAPAAISITVSRLTAPYFSNVSGDTCSRSFFTSLEYATIPPVKYAELPATDVMAAAIPPPVQLSAVERVSFFDASNLPSSSSVFILHFPFFGRYCRVTREKAGASIGQKSLSWYLKYPVMAIMAALSVV